MNRPKIAIIEDESDILDVITYNLEREGYEVCAARHGDEALNLVRNQMPSLVILDLMLPGTDGLTVCRQLKTDTATVDIPIIILSAKAEENDVIIGLGMGADDYLAKPFSPRELVARVRSVMRRGAQRPEPPPDRLTHGELTVDTSKHEVTLAGKRIDLTATEFKILHQLASHPGRALTREQLLDRLGTVIVDRNIDVHIRSIRKKLGDTTKLIETVRGVGYRLAET